MINSRQKGARGERAFSHKINDLLGLETRRGQQYSGANGDADVVGVPGIHCEVKVVERLNIYDAVDQSKRDARENELPCVFHKKNRKEWLVTMPLDDWIKLYNAYRHK